VPISREQIISGLARLEHEKARLERELKMWFNNHNKAQTRIQQVQKRIDILQQMLDELSNQSYPTRSSKHSEEDTEKKVSKYQEVKLEY
jgi:exonuclease VII small subunit